MSVLARAKIVAAGLFAAPFLRGRCTGRVGFKTSQHVSQTLVAPVPPVLIVAAPRIRTPNGPIAPKCKCGEQRCAPLAKAYRRFAAELGCEFLDAAQGTNSSVVDGVHLDADQHIKWGKTLATRARF